MGNRDLDAGWTYHNGTKHSYQSIRANPHRLDWQNQPLPFKIYTKLEPIALPQHLSSSGVAALTAVAAEGPRGGGGAVPDKDRLAEVLYLSAGITKRRSYPGGEILFRAAACTGALYHVDVYLICGDVPGLTAGVYHFGPHDFALRRLRSGDYRPVVVSAAAEESVVASAPVYAVFASTYWRNAWKYQDRAYRHCYWDCGTILANLLAATAVRDIAARVVVGFVDEAIHRLLGLDAEREAVLTLVPLGNMPAGAVVSSPEVEPLTLETEPLSRSQVDYPAIRAMHEASSLDSAQEVIRWRRGHGVGSPSREAGPSGAPLIPLRTLAGQEVPVDSLEQVVTRRGSTRQFAPESITFSQLSTMLDSATRGILTDLLGPGEALNDLYLIVNAVEDLAPGAYVFHRASSALELLKEGDFREDAGYLGLGQEIPADASVDVFFLADLGVIFERFGNRGYRAAQLDASITGGKLYLAAYALRLGASGLTFFDDDVTEFFSPHAAGKSVMFLMALGKSMRRARR